MNAVPCSRASEPGWRCTGRVYPRHLIRWTVERSGDGFRVLFLCADHHNEAHRRMLIGKRAFRFVK